MVLWFKRSKTDGKTTHLILYLHVNEKKRKSREKGGIFSCVTQLGISLRAPWILHSYMSAYGGKWRKKSIDDVNAPAWALREPCASFEHSHDRQAQQFMTLVPASPKGVFLSTTGPLKDQTIEWQNMLSHLVILKANSHLTFISWFWPLSLTMLSF